MKNTALISVIIPCYNGANFIIKTLESVKRQTYSNWECVIIDDGSTDNSKEVINGFIKDNSQFIYHYQDNKGLSGARNIGLDICKGDYVYFLDSDDLISVITLNNLFELTKGDVDIVFGKTATTNGQNETIVSYLEHNLPTNKIIKNDSQALIPLLLENKVSCVAHNRLYKKSFLLKNNLKFKDRLLHEDELWFFETIYHSKAIILNNVPTYFYNVGNQDSITNNFSLKNTLAYIDITKTIYNKYYKNNSSEINKEIASIYVTYLKTITISHCFYLTPNHQKQEAEKLITDSFNKITPERTKEILKPKLEKFNKQFNTVYPLGIKKTLKFIKYYKSKSILKVLKRNKILFESYLRS